MSGERETLRIINNFALQLISLPSKNDLAWFVAREVVGKLGFEDCVVYFYDPETNLIRQSAAIGEDKNPSKNEIRNPLEIAMGEGITGTVARDRKPLIIDDLSNDPRYIADVSAANSEICVPLIADNQLYGVIDCESPHKHHFTPTDMETLTTIAAMASAKLRLLEQDKTLEMHEKLKNAEHETRNALYAANSANQAKSEFLATMSHELRTPLTSIKGALGLLNAHAEERSGIDNSHLLEIALRNCDVLVNLVNDFLDYEKIIAGKMTLEIAPTDINMLANSTVESNQGLARSYGIEFKFEPSNGPVWADADEARYTQILRNLLSNAAKFSPHGSTVHITVSESDGCVRTSVEDFGIGIAPADRSSIFDRFTQIDTTDSRQQGGTGLGLAISKSLAETMNGKLDFRSVVGEGSVFYLDMPKTQSQR